MGVQLPLVQNYMISSTDIKLNKVKYLDFWFDVFFINNLCFSCELVNLPSLDNFGVTCCIT